MKRPYERPTVKRAVTLHYRLDKPPEPRGLLGFAPAPSGRFFVASADGLETEIRSGDVSWMADARARFSSAKIGRFGFPSGVTLGTGPDDAQAFQVYP